MNKLKYTYQCRSKVNFEGKVYYNISESVYMVNDENKRLDWVTSSSLTLSSIKIKDIINKGYSIEGICNRESVGNAFKISSDGRLICNKSIHERNVENDYIISRCVIPNLNIIRKDYFKNAKFVYASEQSNRSKPYIVFECTYKNFDVEISLSEVNGYCIDVFPKNHKEKDLKYFDIIVSGKVSACAGHIAIDEINKELELYKKLGIIKRNRIQIGLSRKNEITVR